MITMVILFREKSASSFLFFCRNSLFAQRFLRGKCVNTDDKIFDRKSKIIGFQLSAEILAPLCFSLSYEMVLMLNVF